MRLSISFFSRASLLAVFVASSSLALRAVSQQQCSNACGNVTSTTASDIVCLDSDFANTPKGQAFQNCLSCQINSTANDPNTGETDLRWALYNMRFAISMCLFGYPSNSSVITTPCVTNPACGLYQSSIEYDSLSPSAAPFDYCASFNGLSANTQPKCQSCLQQQSANYFLSNFFTALVAGCQQQPAVGAKLSLSGGLFSKTALTITTPPSATGTAAAYVPSTGSPSMGTIIGSILGTVVFILVTLGCCIICWGKRRRRAQLQRLAKRNVPQVSEVSLHQPLAEPKWGQSGQVSAGGWGQADSPETAGSEPSFHGFSPYSSKYNSPVSARDALNPKQTWEWPGMRAPAMPSVPASTASPVEKRNFSPYTSPSSAHDAKGPKQDWDRAEAIELERVRHAKRVEEKQKLEARQKAEEEEEEEERQKQAETQEEIREQFLARAAQRGFTTAPIIKAPDRAGKTRGMF